MTRHCPFSGPGRLSPLPSLPPSLFWKAHRNISYLHLNPRNGDNTDLEQEGAIQTAAEKCLIRGRRAADWAGTMQVG